MAGMDIEKAMGRKLPFAKMLGIRLISKGGGIYDPTGNPLVQDSTGKLVATKQK